MDLRRGDMSEQPRQQDTTEAAGLRIYTGFAGKIVTTVAVVMSLYHILFIARVFDRMGIYIQNRYLTILLIP